MPSRGPARDALTTALLAVLGLFGSVAASSAQASWDTECGAETCSISRSVVETNTDRRVATLLVVVEQGSNATTAGAVVPLGTATEPGLRLVHGSTEIEVPVQVCFPDGCRALTALPPGSVEAMDAAGSVEVRFFPWEADRPLAVPVPTAGLAQAVSAARNRLPSP